MASKAYGDVLLGEPQERHPKHVHGRAEEVWEVWAEARKVEAQEKAVMSDLS